MGHVALGQAGPGNAQGVRLATAGMIVVAFINVWVGRDSFVSSGSQL